MCSALYIHNSLVCMQVECNSVPTWAETKVCWGNPKSIHGPVEEITPGTHLFPPLNIWRFFTFTSSVFPLYKHSNPRPPMVCGEYPTHAPDIFFPISGREIFLFRSEPFQRNWTKINQYGKQFNKYRFFLIFQTKIAVKIMFLKINLWILAVQYAPLLQYWSSANAGFLFDVFCSDAQRTSIKFKKGFRSSPW